MHDTDMTTDLPEIHLTDQDLERLRAVVEAYSSTDLADNADALELELDRARVVSQREIPKDVMTMRSRAVFQNLQTGTRRELELVYPNEADPSAGKVSILAPVGLALLGLRAGDTIRWPMSKGRTARLKLLEILYQPEHAGELHL
jgi:regulator of nucleoside diphosphate kinase